MKRNKLIKNLLSIMLVFAMMIVQIGAFCVFADGEAYTIEAISSHNTTTTSWNGGLLLDKNQYADYKLDIPSGLYNITLEVGSNHEVNPKIENIDLKGAVNVSTTVPIVSTGGHAKRATTEPSAAAINILNGNTIRITGHAYKIALYGITLTKAGDASVKYTIITSKSNDDITTTGMDLYGGLGLNRKDGQYLEFESNMIEGNYKVTISAGGTWTTSFNLYNKTQAPETAIPIYLTSTGSQQNKEDFVAYSQINISRNDIIRLDGANGVNPFCYSMTFERMGGLNYSVAAKSYEDSHITNSWSSGGGIVISEKDTYASYKADVPDGKYKITVTAGSSNNQNPSISNETGYGVPLKFSITPTGGITTKEIFTVAESMLIKNGDIIKIKADSNTWVLYAVNFEKIGEYDNTWIIPTNINAYGITLSGGDNKYDTTECIAMVKGKTLTVTPNVPSGCYEVSINATNSNYNYTGTTVKNTTTGVSVSLPINKATATTEMKAADTLWIYAGESIEFPNSPNTWYAYSVVLKKVQDPEIIFEGDEMEEIDATMYNYSDKAVLAETGVTLSADGWAKYKIKANEPGVYEVVINLDETVASGFVKVTVGENDYYKYLNTGKEYVPVFVNIEDTEAVDLTVTSLDNDITLTTMEITEVSASPELTGLTSDLYDAVTVDEYKEIIASIAEELYITPQTDLSSLQYSDSVYLRMMGNTYSNFAGVVSDYNLYLMNEYESESITIADCVSEEGNKEISIDTSVVNSGTMITAGIYLGNVLKDAEVIIADGTKKTVVVNMEENTTIRLFFWDSELSPYDGKNKAAEVVYVSTSGDDSNDGTVNSPVKTLEYARTLAQKKKNMRLIAIS